MCIYCPHVESWCIRAWTDTIEYMIDNSSAFLYGLPCRAVYKRLAQERNERYVKQKNRPGG